MHQEEYEPETTPTVVSREILDGLEAVRQSGHTNMLDRPIVAELCMLMGYAEAADWVLTNRRAYSRGVFHGFRAVE